MTTSSCWEDCGPPILKIADFASARAYKHLCDALPLADAESPLTQGVCTHWYAAVEFMLHDPGYSEKVDVGSVGCLVGELMSVSLLSGVEKGQVLRAMQRQLGPIHAMNCPSVCQEQCRMVLANSMLPLIVGDQTIARGVPEWERRQVYNPRHIPRPTRRLALES